MRSTLLQRMAREELDASGQVTNPTDPAIQPVVEQPEGPVVELVDDLQAAVATDTIEYEIAIDDEDMNSMQEDSQTVAEVADNVEELATEAIRIAKSGKASITTLSVLSMAAEQQLARLGDPVQKLNVESLSPKIDITQQHILAAEGWKEDIAQSFVLQNKHQLNAIADFFKGTSARVQKYKRALADAEGEFNQKKGKLSSGKHEGSLVELWYFFSTQQGASNNLMADLGRDVKLSEYLLKTYPTEVLKLVQKAVAMLKSARLDNAANIEKLAKQFESMPSPASLFKADMAKGSFFDAMALSETGGTQARPLVINGKSFDKLAQLATPHFYVESGSVAHGLKKVARVSVGYGTSIRSGQNKKFELTTQEIGNVIEAGKKYIENVEAYLALDKELVKIDTEALNAFAAVDKTIAPDVKEEATKLMRQIQRFIDTAIFTNFTRPARQEIARSIKGAKYCMYLGKRMIWNAK